MGRWFCALLVCLATLPAFCQAPSPKPQVATITAVTLHPKNAENGDPAMAQYDLSLKVGDTVYVVLFTPASGSNAVKYSGGMNVVVQVGSESIKFTKLGQTHEVPILRRENTPTTTGIDWSRAPGEYFSQKLRHLSEKLGLTPDQQDQIKPILEQEAGEAGQFISNPVLSSEDKLKKLETIVRSSDQKLKPILSADQWQTLQDLRGQQRRELRESLSEKSKD
jgi:Spy/CpxP family protein refolding chaperone